MYMNFMFLMTIIVSCLGIGYSVGRATSKLREILEGRDY